MARAEAPSDADAVLRRAARPDRLWPLGLGVLALYLAGSLWRFDRPLGEDGLVATLHARPTPWIPLLIAAVVVLFRVAGAVEADAGGSPWRWPRVGRRVLIGLAFALPVLAFAVAPVVAVAAVDAGRTRIGPPISLVVDVGIAVR